MTMEKKDKETPAKTVVEEEPGGGGGGGGREETAGGGDEGVGAQASVGEGAVVAGGGVGVGGAGVVPEGGDAPGGEAETTMDNFWPSLQWSPTVQMKNRFPAESIVRFAGPVVMVWPIGLSELHLSKDSFGTWSTSWTFVVKVKAIRTEKFN